MGIRRRNVLLVITDTHHGFLHGVVRYAKEHHWNLAADMIYTGKIPSGWRGDGILCFLAERRDLATFIRRSKLPAVNLSPIGGNLPIPAVTGDHRKIGRMAAEYFLERGFRHFAWAPFMENQAASLRLNGYQERLARSGKSCQILPKLGSGDACDWHALWTQLIEALRSLPKPLAVFAYNDCVAANIVNACDEAGLAVPEAVSVLGVDNDPLFSDSASTPISSICHDLEGIAYRSAQLLDRMMAGHQPKQQTILVPPTGLITRRSTAVLAVQEATLAKALRHITTHFSNPQLDVNAVVRAAGVSRRALERAFNRNLKRSIHSEIRRVRLEKVCELLATSKMNVGQIAASAGFTRANQLHRVFKRQLGTSPQNYPLRLDPAR